VQAVSRVKEYTVLVGTNVGAGSGISLGSGKVLTNFHVVDGAAQVSVRFADNRQESVQVFDTPSIKQVG
jgi:S1-C subfamily serine protease